MGATKVTINTFTIVPPSAKVTNYLTESLVWHELPNQLDESIGKLQPQTILPGNRSPGFAT
jgi:hypothetical protein